MSQRKLLIGFFLIVACSVATLAWIARRNRDDADTTLKVQRTVPQPAATLDDPSRAAADLAPPAREPLPGVAGDESAATGNSTPQTTPATAVVAPSSESVKQRPRHDPELFMRKYSGKDLDALLLAKAHVEREFFQSQTDAIERQFQAGNYKTEVVDRPTDVTLGKSQDTGSLIHSTRTIVRPDGKLERKTVVLDYVAFPDVYQKSDELSWLIIETSKKSKR